MTRSFRLQLALRFTVTMAMGVVSISIISLLTLRAAVDRELDASIVGVASIQAASVTQSASGRMEFHEWELTPSEATTLRDLIRYAQVWSAEGRSLLRSRYMTGDLPLDTGALRRAAEGELAWAEHEYRGMEVRSLYYPLERFGPAHERHVLQVAAPLEARNDMVARLAWLLGAVTLVVIVGSFMGSSWLAQKAVRPVREITDQAEAIEAGSLQTRIDAYADHREYERLVLVLNTMLDRLEEAFEAQKRFIGDASHELRSPLTALRGEIELALRRERSPEEYRRVLASTLEEAVRLSRITENLLTLARSDAGQVRPRLEPAELETVAARTVDRFRVPAEQAGVDLSLVVDGEDTRGSFDPGLLGQVAWNLTDNAIRFTPRGGRVEVRACGQGEDLRLEVTDTGPGLGSGDPQRVFQRFYREDPSRSHHEGDGGAGLGLSIVRAIVESHGGWVHAENRQEGGARFLVVIPRDPESAGVA